MPYNPEVVRPMRDELVRLGAEELLSAADVDAALTDASGTALLVINSVCGCAAGNARPALAIATGHEVQPDKLLTVFAGQDLEATDRARELFGDVPPSSPSVALMKNGEMVGHAKTGDVTKDEVLGMIILGKCPPGARAKIMCYRI